MEDLWRDLRYTVRTMRKSPMFVLFVVLTLALGIGANTTVFTVINTLILHPLPVPDSSEVAAVGMAKTESTKSSAPLPMSHAELKDYQALNGVFRSLAGYTSPRGVTWQTSAAFPDANTDIAALSHEISEWYNDPFGGNKAPAWQAPPEQGVPSALLGTSSQIPQTIPPPTAQILPKILVYTFRKYARRPAVLSDGQSDIKSYGIEIAVAVLG